MRKTITTDGKIQRHFEHWLFILSAFIYTPSWSRYFTKFSKEQRYFNKKDLILNNLSKNNILTIDLTKFMNKENNLKKYFPLGYIGHFNKQGYEKISSIVIEEIEKTE